MGKEYLVEGARLMCIHGSEVSLLKVPVGHGYISGGRKKANCRDCKACENIPYFGGCRLNKTSHTCEGFMKLADRWENTEASLTKPEKVDGEDAITMDSVLLCKKGGVIIPLTSGQGYEERVDLLAFWRRFRDVLLWAAGKDLGCQAFGGDPVNMNTGNFVYEKEDLVTGGRTKLSFGMCYNSVDGHGGCMGEGWRHSGEWGLEEGAGGMVYLHTREGKRVPYSRSTGDIYTPPLGGAGLLKGVPGGFLYAAGGGLEYRFDSAGRLLWKTDREGNRDSYSYDAEGRLAEASGANGGRLTYHYNREGRLTRVSDHTGREVCLYYSYGKLKRYVDACGHAYTYTYNENGRLESVETPGGVKAFENRYDSLNRVVRQEMADGGVTELKYDDRNLTTWQKEPNGNIVAYESDERFRNTRTVYQDGEEAFAYNDKNQIRRHVDKLGNVTRYQYDERGNLTGVTDALGYKVTMKYDKENRIVSKTWPNGGVLNNVYDKNGKLTERVDSSGNFQKMDYDEHGQLTNVSWADGSEIHISYDKCGNIMSVTDSLENCRRYEYDDLNRVIAAWDGNNHKTEFVYDKNNNLIERINAYGDKKQFERDARGKVIAIKDYDGTKISMEYGLSNKIEVYEDKEGNKTRYIYDKMGNMKAKTLPNGAVQSYSYDLLNRLKQYTDELGHTIGYEYDAGGNCVKMIGVTGEETRYSYDALNRMTMVTEPDGAVTSYEYDEQGKCTKVVYPGGLTEEFAYDVCGRIEKHKDIYGNSTLRKYNILGLTDSITDGKGLKTAYEYYSGGFLKKIKYPDGTSESFRYDGNGNITQKDNQAGYSLYYEYDLLDRITKITSSLGERIEYRYDAAGNMTALTDGNGNIREYAYSPNGNILAVKEPDGGESIYGYDCMGNLISIGQEETPGRVYWEEAVNMNQRQKRVILFERDAAGKLTAMTDAFGNTETYSYDAHGWLEMTKDREGNDTRYTYDCMGNIKSVQYSDGRGVEYEYNALRQLVKMKDWLGTTEVESDVFGRVVSVTNHNGESVGYEYGKLGEKTAVIYPDGGRAEYRYDAFMRLETVRSGRDVIQYRYDKNGRLKEKAFPGNVQTCYEYDASGRVTRIVSKDGQGVLDELAYAYDMAGNRASMKKMRRGMPGQGGNYRYRYDCCNRLIGVEKGGKQVRGYSYDAFGNRTCMEVDGIRQSYTYNEMNQLVSQSGRVNRAYTYDRRGNLTDVYEEGGNVASYGYDAANRVAYYRGTGRNEAKYIYNGLGQRVGMEKGAARDPERHTVTAEEYVIDLTRGYHNILQRRTVDGMSERKSFIWDEGPLAMRDSQSLQYMLRDEMDTPIRLLYYNGVTAEANDYDEFGNLENGSWTGMQPFGFTGYYKDPATGNYFAQAREYIPGEGRFAAEDVFCGSIGVPASLNRFMYCFNNPLSYWDPWGYFTTAEGKEAHEALQEVFRRMYPGRGYTEFKVEGYKYSITGKGRIDILLMDNGRGYAEVYEIKPISQYFQKPLPPTGLQQRKGYIEALVNMDIKIKVDPEGRTFDPHGWTLPSALHPEKNIRYYTYPQEPGMICWGYVNKPRVAFVNKKENADNKGNLDEESTWDEALETAAIVGGFIWAAAKIIFEIIQAVMYGRPPSFAMKGCE